MNQIRDEFAELDRLREIPHVKVIAQSGEILEVGTRQRKIGVFVTITEQRGDRSIEVLLNREQARNAARTLMVTSETRFEFGKEEYYPGMSLRGPIQVTLDKTARSYMAEQLRVFADIAEQIAAITHKRGRPGPMLD